MAVEEAREATEPEAAEAVEAVEGSAVSEAARAAAAVAAQALYSIAPGHTLNVRSGPGTQYRLIRTLAPGSRVPIFCQRPGETISGPYGTTKIWDNIEVGEYVSDAYVHTGSDGYVASRCA
ncbi:SH3 domain-containing protein [Streptomyces sp. NPDC020707]|uniref:SH3 domain-containing protein n=1 Tax=Streptomyces sp. NPDC020707 TaxID=3365084 RepID=UPI003787F258